MNTCYITKTRARFKKNTLYIRIYKLTQYIDLHIPSFVHLLHIITTCKTKMVTNNLKKTKYLKKHKT